MILNHNFNNCSCFNYGYSWEVKVIFNELSFKHKD